MEELMFSFCSTNGNNVADEEEVKLKENMQPAFTSVGELKDRLIEIAAMAYGSGVGEGKDGGRGHIGILGGRIVKFNTKSDEYKASGSRSYQSSEHKDKMYNASNNLRERMLEMASSLLQGYMMKAFDEFGGAASPGKNTEKAHKKIIEKSQKLKEQGKDDPFTRRDAAKMVTFICHRVKDLLGVDFEDEVWGAAKKLARKSHGNTQEQFAQQLKTVDEVTDMKSEVDRNGKTLVEAVIDAATAASRKSSNFANGSKVLPRVTRFVKDGSRVSIESRKPDPKSNQKSFEKRVTVKTVDYFDAWRFDRLKRIRNAVTAMIDTMIERQPTAGLRDFFAYGEPQRRSEGDTTKYAESEFNRRMNARQREDVLHEAHAEARDISGMSEKNYKHILGKLRDHFISIANKDIVVNNQDKATAQAVARELSQRIALFLDEQISLSGGETTEDFVWNADKSTGLSFDQAWSDSLALNFNKALGGEDEDKIKKFWREDNRMEFEKGNAKVDAGSNARNEIVDKEYKVTKLMGENQWSEQSLVLVDDANREAAKLIIDECIKELKSKPSSSDNTLEVQEKFVKKLSYLRDRSEDNENYRLPGGNGETCKGLRLKQDLLRKVFAEKIVTRLGFALAGRVPAAPAPRVPVQANAQAPEWQTDESLLKVKDCVVGELGSVKAGYPVLEGTRADDIDDQIKEEYYDKMWDGVIQNCQTSDSRVAFAWVLREFSTHCEQLAKMKPSVKIAYIEALEEMERILRSPEISGNGNDVFQVLAPTVSGRLGDKKLEELLLSSLKAVKDIYGDGEKMKSKPVIPLNTDCKVSELGGKRERWSAVYIRVVGNSNLVFDPSKFQQKIMDDCRGKDLRCLFARAIDYITDSSGILSVGDTGKAEMKHAYLHTLRKLKKIIDDADVNDGAFYRFDLCRKLQWCCEIELSKYDPILVSDINGVLQLAQTAH